MTRKLNISMSLMLAMVVPSAAQVVRISEFRAETGAVESRRTVLDAGGRPCAQLRMRTYEEGWTFEAGMEGIMDVEVEPGWVNVYVPASARSVTVARAGCKPLRDWFFPERLVEGALYIMRLKVDNDGRGAERSRGYVPAKPSASAVTPPARTVPSSPAPGPRASAPVEEKHFCTEFADLYLGFDMDEFVCGGIRYTHLENRVGGYGGLGFSIDETIMVLGGAAFRLTDEFRNNMDIQCFVGCGLGETCVLETGIRFAFKNESGLSFWDFGLGLQLGGGVLMPTIELGLCIWGIPLLCTLGVAL